MRALRESLFRAVGFCFSALLLVMSLLCSIKLAAVSDEAAELEARTAQHKTDNEILRAEYESSVSLARIEDYAARLGMQRPEPGQIYYMDGAGDK